MNVALFNLINGWAGRNHLLDAVMIFLAEYMWVVMVLGVLWLAYKKRNKDVALSAIGWAGFARVVIVSIIKWLYVAPRPDLVLKIHQIVTPDNQNSFPSGHATFVFALAQVVYLYDKKWGAWYLVLAALVSFSRVFVGVHWPADVLAGLVLGLFVGWAGDKLYRRYKHIFGL